MREIMPQLDSVDAGEGTHIIFAPQSAPLRRQPEDLDPFERTVFNYLGLTHPRALLSNIEEFIESQTKAEHELGEELTEARKSIDTQIAEVQTSRSRILIAPPWGGGPPPPLTASEQKVRSFIQEITGKPLDKNLEGLSLEALINSAEESLKGRRTQSQSSLEKEAKELAEHRVHLENLRNVQTQIKRQKSIIQSTNSELKTALDGLTPDELREKFETAKYEATTESIKGRIVQDTIALISRDESKEFLCPICDSSHDRQILDSHLQNASDHTGSMHSTVTALESQVQKSRELEDLLETQEAELLSLNRNKSVASDRVDDEDKRKLAETNDIDPLIEGYLEKEFAIKAQIDDQETWFTLKHGQLNKLKDESRFHQIQRHLNTLNARKMELRQVTETYNNLVAFGASIGAIKEVVETSLSERIAQDIPRVSETLSKAFNALTQHTWYDRLIISEATLPKLELRVASSQDPIREDPTGVLNGQAESALNLVPYFAFSQTDENTPTEVYLVMLDDPTRALDTEHIRILVERLQELGNNVQLIVASQETERFQNMIPNAFDRDSYVIIEPTGWSPDSGPNLKIKYE